MPILELNRPMHVGSPEPILSDLAWSLFPNSSKLLAYEKTEIVKRPKQLVTYTRPLGGEEDILKQSGFEIDKKLAPGKLLFDSMRGVIAGKASSYPAMALVPAAAFLQNVDGFARKKGTADFAKITEQIFTLGKESGAGEFNQSAAFIWYNTLLNCGDDPFFDKFHTAVSLVPSVKELNLDFNSPRTPSYVEHLNGVPAFMADQATPFRWFNRSWRILCSPEWRKALPRRRWLDWCACLLRTGIGMGYLWEARYYRRLNEICIGSSTAINDFKWLSGTNEPLLAWENPDLRISARDITTSLKSTLAIGHASREIIVEYCKATERIASIEELRAFMMSTMPKEALNKLKKALHATVDGKGKNTYETVRYLLQSRCQDGKDQDLYSLLVSRKPRFLFVDPAPEWITVIASMAAGKPGCTTTLAHLNAELASLGLYPNREILVRELERAGLTRSSHDADEALEISTAF